MTFERLLDTIVTGKEIHVETVRETLHRKMQLKDPRNITPTDAK